MINTGKAWEERIGLGIRDEGLNSDVKARAHTWSRCNIGNFTSSGIWKIFGVKACFRIFLNWGSEKTCPFCFIQEALLFFKVFYCIFFLGIACLSSLCQAIRLAGSWIARFFPFKSFGLEC